MNRLVPRPIGPGHSAVSHACCRSLASRARSRSLRSLACLLRKLRSLARSLAAGMTRSDNFSDNFYLSSPPPHCRKHTSPVKYGFPYLRTYILKGSPGSQACVLHAQDYAKYSRLSARLPKLPRGPAPLQPRRPQMRRRPPGFPRPSSTNVPLGLGGGGKRKPFACTSLRSAYAPLRFVLRLGLRFPPPARRPARPRPIPWSHFSPALFIVDGSCDRLGIRY